MTAYVQTWLHPFAAGDDGQDGTPGRVELGRFSLFEFERGLGGSSTEEGVMTDTGQGKGGPDKRTGNRVIGRGKAEAKRKRDSRVAVMESEFARSQYAKKSTEGCKVEQSVKCWKLANRRCLCRHATFFSSSARQG